MGVLGYNCYTPDYSDMNKMLVNEDGEIINDIHYFNAVKGTQSEGMALGLATPQDFVPDFFADGLSDQELFDSVLPKSIQTNSELESYGNIFLEDLNRSK